MSRGVSLSGGSCTKGAAVASVCTIVTAGMAAGVSDRLWEMGDVFEVMRIEIQKLAALAPAVAW